MSNVHHLEQLGGIRIKGEVAANIWRGVDSADETRHSGEKSPLPADQRYPASAQYDLIVRGTSINRVAPDGFRLRVVDAHKAGIVNFAENQLVIVRRTRDDGQIVETTAKRLRHTANQAELWPDSDDPQWKSPLILGTDPERETVEIIGIVLYAYHPTGTGRD